MIHADLWDNGSGANWLPTSYATIGNANVVFTDATTGVGTGSYAWGATAPNYSGLCQECHETADVDFTSFKDDTSVSLSPHPAAGANPGDCTGCHRHREAFRPNLCEDCHDGTETLAPNVINGQTPYNAAVSYNWYGSVGTKQDGGHGDAQGTAAVACIGCHDLSQPAANLHLNGSYESLWNNSTRNANTSHLQAAYFTPYTGVGGSGNAWDVQVTFDNYCANQCHPAGGRDGRCATSRTRWRGDSNHWSVEFGTHMTYTNGDTRPYPIDLDLNTGATGTADYAPCISCHDPHGTTVVEPTRTSNRMVRDVWTIRRRSATGVTSRSGRWQWGCGTCAARWREIMRWCGSGRQARAGELQPAEGI